MTVGQIVDQVVLNVYGGKPSDDQDLSRSQVASWASLVRDALAKDYLDMIIRNGKPIPTEYQIREVLEANTEDLDPTPEEDERIFLTLQYQPMSLLNDVAIQRVLSDDGVMVNKSRSENIDWIKDLKYAKPTVKNPVYYRDNRKVILEGISYKNPKQWIVYYIPTAESQNLEEADELTISAELLDSLLTRLTDLAKQQLGVPSDTINDGQDNE